MPFLSDSFVPTEVEALGKMSDVLRMLGDEAEKFALSFNAWAESAAQMKRADRARLTTPGRMAYRIASLFGRPHFEIMEWLEDCPGALKSS